MDQFLRWIVGVDDWLRVDQGRALALCIPVGLVVFILGAKSLWVAVAVIGGALMLATLVVVYARRRLDMPARHQDGGR